MCTFICFFLCFETVGPSAELDAFVETIIGSDTLSVSLNFFLISLDEVTAVALFKGF